MPLTAKEVWDSAMSDPKMRAQAPIGTAREDAIRPFIEAVPRALAPYLEKKVTLQTYIDTKLAFLRHCVQSGFPEIMAHVLDTNQDLIKSKLEGLVEMLEDMTKDIPAFLKNYGMTEDDILLNSKVGLNEANKDLYKSGELTVEHLLRTQASIILNNT